MYNCKCHIGQTFNKCDKSAHIQALDYRAATFEQLEELERAKKDAEWMLELAPRLPDVRIICDLDALARKADSETGLLATRKGGSSSEEERVCLESV